MIHGSILGIEQGDALVISSVVAMIGAVASAFIALSGRKHAREANEAVNMRHLKGVDEKGVPVNPRLYDAVLDIHSGLLDVNSRTDRMSGIQAAIKESVDVVTDKVLIIEGTVVTLRQDVDALKNTSPTPPTEGDTAA